MASSMPPCGGSWFTAEHGMLAVRSIGTCDMSGACTFASVSFCGQLRVAVVWVTGRKGVAIANSAPSTPVTIATRRAIRKSLGATFGSGSGGVFVSTAVATSGTLACYLDAARGAGRCPGAYPNRVKTHPAYRAYKPPEWGKEGRLAQSAGKHPLMRGVLRR